MELHGKVINYMEKFVENRVTLMKIIGTEVTSSIIERFAQSFSWLAKNRPPEVSF